MPSIKRMIHALQKLPIKMPKVENIITVSESLPNDYTETFLEVVEASLRITKREHFFSWLQTSCQYLFPHEVLLCAVRVKNEQRFRFETFISTRYVTEQHIKSVTDMENGILPNVIESWRKSRRPHLLSDGIAVGDFGTHVVPVAFAGKSIHEVELRNIAAHGLCSEDGEISTFFSFSRIPGDLNAGHAYMLQLLVPHLHSALIRIAGDIDSDPSDSKSNNLASLITHRERQILEWVHKGKTNWEIANILEISPLTVKNHIQNILRKLNVQNRGHAVAKATKLGLVKV
jgi:transcriptional regulator EpsA